MTVPDGARVLCCDTAWASEYSRRARLIMQSYARADHKRPIMSIASWTVRAIGPSAAHIGTGTQQRCWTVSGMLTRSFHAAQEANASPSSPVPAAPDGPRAVA